MTYPSNIKDRRDRETGAEAKRVAKLGVPEACICWPSDADRAHIWLAGFQQGYFARKQEKKKK